MVKKLKTETEQLEMSLKGNAHGATKILAPSTNEPLKWFCGKLCIIPS